MWSTRTRPRGTLYPAMWRWASPVTSSSVTCWPSRGLDDGDDPLAPPLVGDADDDRVEHAGMRLQGALDLLRVDLLATAVDRHRAAPEHGDRPVLLAARVVAGDGPAHPIDDGERRGALHGSW